MVMPVFNESDGVAEFVTEIFSSLEDRLETFVIVDDCSTDSTSRSLKNLVMQGIPIKLHFNQKNQGHGPSTVKALSIGLLTEAQIIVAVDGDGQFFSEDIRGLVDLLESSDIDIVEGVRSNPQAVLYRRIVSQLTRVLVGKRCGVTPLDANTPLRVYQRDVLVNLLSRLPESPVTPNLIISAKARASKLRIVEEPVKSRSRRGTHKGGSTWGSEVSRYIPTWKFLRFCVIAAVQWTSDSNLAKRLVRHR